MKTIKHEIKLEKSVKIILAVFAIGIFLNAFSSPISKELLGTSEAEASLGRAHLPINIVCLKGCK